jgi:hypothetical protein
MASHTDGYIFLLHSKHVSCSTLTEDLLNIKRKGGAKSRTLSRTSDTTETWNPCVIEVILLACSTYIDIFKFIKSLLTYRARSSFHGGSLFVDFPEVSRFRS